MNGLTIGGVEEMLPTKPSENVGPINHSQVLV